jgi:menaquinol-cytochrome c reductase iron-sulfur subunit
MPEAPHMSRREFVTTVTVAVGTIMGAVIVVPAIGYIITPAVNTQESDAWVALGPLENFPLDEPTLVNFVRTKVNGWEKTSTSYGAYVLRGEGEQATVLSNACTHLSCRVNWKTETQLYVCPCHDAKFNKDGTVSSGPPPKPLNEYENKVEEGILYIHFVEA